jgi:hypothetical protein
MLFGAAIYWGTCIWYSIKVGLLNCEDTDELFAEFINLTTYNVMGVKKTDTAKDIRRMVSSLTGESAGKSLTRICLVWPDAMAKVQPKMKEAYEILRKKYGVRSFKKSAT